MAKVHNDVAMLISEINTCVTNDDLTGARTRLCAAISAIDATVGGEPTLIADAPGGLPGAKGLDDMTVSELRRFAADANPPIDLPGRATRDELLDTINEVLDDRGVTPPAG